MRLTLIMLLLCVGFYSLAVLGIAQLAPNHGKGEMITDSKGKSYYANIGQRFDGDEYFNSRPSAVDYNAAGSGGSNKGPNNPDFLKEVQERVDAFKIKNPGVEVPVEMVNASGSGLDPDISVNAALAQVSRISKIRGMNSEMLQELIKKQTHSPVAGPQTINVLKLNIELEKLK